MRKRANISPYMRRPLVIYDFATAPFWISLYMRKNLFYFLSVYWILYFWDFFGSEGTYLRYIMYCRYWIGTYYCIFWNLESGSFCYLRNSVCKYIRNSAEFRGIPANFTAKNTAKFRGIPRYSVCFSKNSVFRRKSKTHFRGHPKCSPRPGQVVWSVRAGGIDRPSQYE